MVSHTFEKHKKVFNITFKIISMIYVNKNKIWFHNLYSGFGVYVYNRLPAISIFRFKFWKFEVLTLSFYTLLF